MAILHNVISFCIFVVAIPKVNPSTTTAGIYENIPTTANVAEKTTLLDDDIEKLQDAVAVREGINESIAEVRNDVNALESDMNNLKNLFKQIKDTLDGAKALSTCQDYYDVGIRESGLYFIDPDKSDGPIQPMKVYCNMNALPGYGITEFQQQMPNDTPAHYFYSHDSEQRILVNGCENPGCYRRDVVYNQTLIGIRATMYISEFCRQYIKYECQNSMMFSYVVETSWTSYDGVEQFYWGGAESGSKMCACGKNNTCNGASKTCNCDLNDDVWREDSGYLTDKESLPVAQLAFGDAEASHERGYHTLGQLECYGKSTGDGLTCADLKKQGKSSGYYYINPDPRSVTLFRVYCDMDSYPKTGTTVIHHDKETEKKLSSSSGTVDIPITYSNWKCYYTGFLNYGTYWVARDGSIKRYWGGAKPDHDYFCACGEDGTCFNGYSYKCNCESPTSTWNIDRGDLIDKTALPVTKLHFQYYTSSSNYYGYYILGPLKCF